MIAAVDPHVRIDVDDAVYLARALDMLPRLLTDARRQPTPKLLAAIEKFRRATAVAGGLAGNASGNARTGPGCAADPADSGHDDPCDTVNTGTAAAILGVSPNGVRDLARRGKLPARRSGSRWVYPAAAVVARAENQAAQRNRG